MMANDELKDFSQSKHHIYDHALPCEGEECRVYYVDQICHFCNSREALGAGYPLNKNYGLTVAHVLEWSIPHNQMRFEEFREISYIDPKKDVDEEQPVSPKGLFREITYNSTRFKTDYDTPTTPKGGAISPEIGGSLEGSAVQRSEIDNEAN
jgi:hypothetical protein